MIPTLSNKVPSYETIATLKVMQAQEEKTYCCGDYLYQQQLGQSSIRNGPLSSSAAPVDAACRSKMSRWCYQIVDFCKLSRETVAIAMNYLDRYLMTDSGRYALMTRKIYQLAAMTSLYLAIKLHEPETTDPSMISELSHGVYTEEQVVEMEVSILDALKWRVNTPTAMAFTRQYIRLMPESMSSELRDAVLKMACTQVEEAIHDYRFVTVKASTIAFASIVNALEILVCSKDMISDITESINKIASNNDSSSMKTVQKRLCRPAKGTSLSRHSKVSSKFLLCDSVQGSPRSVVRKTQMP